MKIESLNPKDIIPLEAPHRRNVVRSLMSLFEDESRQEEVENLPFIFVHRIRNEGIFMVDGHHRTGVAHLYGKNVNAIFLNTFRDLSDAYVLRDLQMIPYFEFGFPIENKILNLSQELLETRERCALESDVRNFDDFVEMIKQDEYACYDPRPRLVIGPRLVYR